MASQSSVISTANTLGQTNALLLRNTPIASIEFLPAEILLIIFKLVFMGSQVRVHRFRHLYDCDDKLFKTLWVEEEDRQNPCIFPYATSLVCSRWRSLMKTVPIFWTRVVIFVDAHPTPLVRLREHLKLSGDLPLDLYVLRRSGTYDLPDPEEHVRCTAVIDVLRYYFRRCRVISFDVIHSSSLPSITREMYGWAHHLVNLELKCHMDDGQQYVSRPDKRRHTTKPFTFPILQKLHVDGRNFADACMYLPSWCDALSRPRPLDVTISNFRPILNNVDHPCRVRDVAEALSHVCDISTLSLVNVEFESPEGDIEDWDDEPVSIAVMNLCFTDVPRAFQDSLLQFIEMGLQSLHITRSPLPHYVAAFLATEMVLEDISQHEDLPSFLRLWSGLDLEILGCEGFDDRAVKALGVDHHTTTASISYERCYFAINDCPNVSPSALKELIQMRHNANAIGQESRCILSVTGKGTLLPKDDRTWFEENLESLIWKTEPIS